jgi:hypothetical protein
MIDWRRIITDDNYLAWKKKTYSCSEKKEIFKQPSTHQKRNEMGEAK